MTIEVGSIIEMPDGHNARVTGMTDRTMRVEYDDGDKATVPRLAEPYLCKTCGQTVPVNEHHEHGCPVEGDTCSSRRCNETGLCQA